MTTGTGVGVGLARRPSIRGTINTPIAKPSTVTQQHIERKIAAAITGIERLSIIAFLAHGFAYYTRMTTKGNAHAIAAWALHGRG
jgi:hypothetical protein